MQELAAADKAKVDQVKADEAPAPHHLNPGRGGAANKEVQWCLLAMPLEHMAAADMCSKTNCQHDGSSTPPWGWRLPCERSVAGLYTVVFQGPFKTILLIVTNWL